MGDRRISGARQPVTLTTKWASDSVRDPVSKQWSGGRFQNIPKVDLCPPTPTWESHCLLMTSLVQALAPEMGLLRQAEWRLQLLSVTCHSRGWVQKGEGMCSILCHFTWPLTFSFPFTSVKLASWTDLAMSRNICDRIHPAFATADSQN